MPIKGDRGLAVVSRFKVLAPVKVLRILPDGRLNVEVTKTTDRLARGARSVINPEDWKGEEPTS